MIEFLESFRVLGLPALIKLLVFLALWCNTIHWLGEKGDVFHIVHRFVVGMPGWIAKPVVNCINCMASLHGAIILSGYLLLKGMSFWYFPASWVILVMAGAFINGIVYLFYSILLNLNHKINLENEQLHRKGRDDEFAGDRGSTS